MPDYKSTADEDARGTLSAKCRRCGGDGSITYFGFGGAHRVECPVCAGVGSLSVAAPNPGPMQAPNREPPPGMTDDERALLLTTARILRAQISERIAIGQGRRYDRIDHAGLNQALAPFDAAPGEPKNKASE